ncbi:DJC76 [Scenedesmus sp. PABB004]|nr:DJC76 [Scenedesmus sp. PABB004]
MRQYHPDTHAEDTNEFAALLNQIYTALSDPEARALYDAVAGFSADAVNPFEDDGFPVDQVFVDEVSCIGCGKCVRACPQAFFIEASKYGRARVVPGADVAALAEDVEVAILTCPVDCIHQVTSPQLALLEAALAGMARVDAFVMMRCHSAAGNVFEEANRAWLKRQARAAALREQAEFSVAGGGAGGWASLFGQHVEMRRPGAAPGGAGGADDGDAAGRDPARRRVAELAGAASRAMRRWRQYSRVAAAQKAALTD